MLFADTLAGDYLTELIVGQVVLGGQKLLFLCERD